MENDLHPCPRCGSTAVGVVADDWDENFRGECEECGYAGPQEMDYTWAHDAWNAQTPPTRDTR